MDLKLPELEADIQGRTVLVTGAAGSIGSELARQLAANSPGRLVLLDQAESDLYFVDLEISGRHPELEVVPVVADVLDSVALDELFQEYRPERVYHAAAYKQVPLMELNSRTAVRFGNVLGSAGSVIPLFQKQISAGGLLTITHPNVSRYFMTIAEAVQLVLEAGLLDEVRGEVAMLEMGEPVFILDLARILVRLQGLRPGGDIRFTFTGLRPGEKLHETLHCQYEALERTPLPEVHRLVIHRTHLTSESLAGMMGALEQDTVSAAEVLTALVGSGWEAGPEVDDDEVLGRAVPA